MLQGLTQQCSPVLAQGRRDRGVVVVQHHAACAAPHSLGQSELQSSTLGTEGVFGLPIIRAASDGGCSCKDDTFLKEFLLHWHSPNWAADHGEGVAVLCCVVWRCVLLCCAVLCRVVWRVVVLCCIVLYCVVLCCVVLCCFVMGRVVLS